MNEVISFVPFSSKRLVHFGHKYFKVRSPDVLQLGYTKGGHFELAQISPHIKFLSTNYIYVFHLFIYLFKI